MLAQTADHVPGIVPESLPFVLATPVPLAIRTINEDGALAKRREVDNETIIAHIESEVVGQILIVLGARAVKQFIIRRRHFVC